MKGFALGAVALLAAALHAQTVNLHGIVSNKAGKPVAKAAVSVVGLGIADTTASDGVYVIAKAPNVGIAQAFPTGRIAVSRSVLELSLGRPAPVRIEVMDLKGRLLQKEVRDEVPAGRYRLPLTGAAAQGGMVLVRARIGESTVSLRCVPSAGTAGMADLPTASGEGSLFRVGAFSDTLKVVAAGYATARIAITSYDQALDVTLDSETSVVGRSAGCGKSLGSLKTGYYKITSNGTSRDYAIDIPASYNPSKAYRLVYCSHWIYASDKDIVNGTVSPTNGTIWAFFGLKHQADSSGDPAIFIAPTALGGMWGQQDHALFNDLLDYAKGNLCIDTARVFATGFSFGAMQTYSLSLSHQHQLRAVAAEAAADYNIWLPTNTHKPIAYLGMVGMSDTRCPPSTGMSCAKTHATDNGCTVPATIPTTTAGSKTHQVYDFTGCKSGYPVKFITFDGGHIAAPADGGSSDNGSTTWAPRVVWKFFTQF